MSIKSAYNSAFQQGIASVAQKVAARYGVNPDVIHSNIQQKIAYNASGDFAQDVGVTGGIGLGGYGLENLGRKLEAHVNDENILKGMLDQYGSRRSEVMARAVHGPMAPIGADPVANMNKLQNVIQNVGVESVKPYGGVGQDVQKAQFDKLRGVVDSANKQFQDALKAEFSEAYRANIPGIKNNKQTMKRLHAILNSLEEQQRLQHLDFFDKQLANTGQSLEELSHAHPTLNRLSRAGLKGDLMQILGRAGKWIGGIGATAHVGKKLYDTVTS